MCRHRGATLCTTDTGNVGNAIRCPYHAWAYRFDGPLITAPNWEAMSAIGRPSYGLHKARLEVWNGLVWVNLGDDDIPLYDGQLRDQLEYRLGPNLDVLDRYGIGELTLGHRITYEVDANRKLILENFQECHHCGTIHPELVEAVPAFQAPGLAVGGYNHDGYRLTEGHEAFSITGERRLPRLPGPRSDDDLKYFGMVLRPNAFLSLTPDHVIVHRFEPLSPTRTRAVCDWLFPPEVAREGDHDPSVAVELFHRVNEQDFRAAQWCQSNMTSRAGGVLVPSEQPIINQWYDWYHASMGVK
ncbi:SRPBCC family protein [Streptomyces sp. CA-249302]|uniref:SRPBCC family protein n=1 Tax=Streptomyces sp. CA-249302 TaxID=3240058 RepID=UPI003D8E9B0E